VILTRTEPAFSSAPTQCRSGGLPDPTPGFIAITICSRGTPPLYAGLFIAGKLHVQKTLTDVPEEDQNRFDPYLDIENPGLEFSRADYDRTHALNFNAIYELRSAKARGL
jgi:hypothetical protein